MEKDLIILDLVKNPITRNTLSKVNSVKYYRIFEEINGKKIKGHRVEAGKEFSLSVEKLYQAYCVLERPIKTTQLKKYICPQSPTKAILDAIE